MGIVLYSGAIIISLLAMRSRAPQWLLLTCGAWTIFTLANVSWQPLMVFQLAVIWGGFAFLAPKDLAQRKFWNAKTAKVSAQETLTRLRALSSEHQPRSASADHSDARPQPAVVPPASVPPPQKANQLNKTIITQIFLWILAINIAVHLFPFDYPSTLAYNQIGRAVGSTIGIFLISLLGLLVKPFKTFAMALIAIVIAPIGIVAERAQDPVAPPIFRELVGRAQHGPIATDLAPPVNQEGYYSDQTAFGNAVNPKGYEDGYHPLGQTNPYNAPNDPDTFATDLSAR